MKPRSGRGLWGRNAEFVNNATLMPKGAPNMRNYIRLRCLRLYPLPFDPDTFYVVFGGTDENLIYWKDKTIAEINEFPPITGPVQFEIPEPSVIWFELDQENLAQLVNIYAGQVWTDTRLNDRFASQGRLYDMTKVEVQGSPRKVWSHGH